MAPGSSSIDYAPRDDVDEAGFRTVYPKVERWPNSASSEQIAKSFDGAARRMLDQLDQVAANSALSDAERIMMGYYRAVCFNSDGRTDEAYDALVECRRLLERNADLAKDNLYTIIYLQGLVGLRKGETENCIMCRGESSCILPISTEAIHENETGSRMAIRHFTEYLAKFPEDMGVRWLLNVAHMTLGEHPRQVDPRYLVSLELFNDDKAHAIGRFRDIGHKVGINRLNLGGGGIFQNPGHENAWVTLKLVGSKTNRAAIGTRIKVVTPALTVHRTVTSGSSFGANPLQQTIGLAGSRTIDRVEIFWPVSQQTQVLTDIHIGEARTIVEP